MDAESVCAKYTVINATPSTLVGTFSVYVQCRVDDITSDYAVDIFFRGDTLMYTGDCDTYVFEGLGDSLSYFLKDVDVRKWSKKVVAAPDAYYLKTVDESRYIAGLEKLIKDYCSERGKSSQDIVRDLHNDALSDFSYDAVVLETCEFLDDWHIDIPLDAIEELAESSVIINPSFEYACHLIWHVAHVVDGEPSIHFRGEDPAMFSRPS